MEKLPEFLELEEASRLLNTMHISLIRMAEQGMVRAIVATIPSLGVKDEWLFDTKTILQYFKSKSVISMVSPTDLPA